MGLLNTRCPRFPTRSIAGFDEGHMISMDFCDDILITFVVLKTGRRIPIDPKTGKAHNCRPCVYCNKPLVFSDLYVGPSGHMYPVDLDTEERHRCDE